MSTGTAPRRFLADEGGGVALEFAIVGLAFVLATLGLIEFGRALQARNELAFAADFGARQILIDPDLGAADIEAAIAAHFDGYDPDSLGVEVGSETVDGDDYRTIDLSYPVNLSIPGYDGALTLRISRRVPRL